MFWILILLWNTRYPFPLLFPSPHRFVGCFGSPSQCYCATGTLLPRSFPLSVFGLYRQREFESRPLPQSSDSSATCQARRGPSRRLSNCLNSHIAATLRALPSEHHLSPSQLFSEYDTSRTRRVPCQSDSIVSSCRV
jgi:hypothetical protein